MPPQFTYADFKNDEEAISWVQSKALPHADPSKPDRVHPSNWRLSEYWYYWDAGTKFKKDATLTEEMARDATDTSAGMAILGSDHEEPKKKCGRISMEQKHKTMFNRVSAQCSKLAKAIAQAETCLPAFRRKLSQGDFKCFKLGVQKCREEKEFICDELEDLKTLAGDEAAQEEQLEKLKTLLQQAVTHLDALAESKKSHEPDPPAAIKNEAAQGTPEEAPGAVAPEGEGDDTS